MKRLSTIMLASLAAAALAGQYLGAGDPRRATRSVLVACAAAAGP